MKSDMTTDLSQPASVLAVGAHPDDIDFSCGASLAKWAASGAVIHELVCTDGSKGSWDPMADQKALAEMREHEQIAAHRALGGTGSVIFLRSTDGELDNSADLRREICHWIRVLKPDVVLGHDPWRQYTIHPDHRAAGFLMLDAVVAAGEALFFPQHPARIHRVQTVLLWKAQHVDHLENVGGHAEAKVQAVLAHKSQYQATYGVAPGQVPDISLVRDGVVSRLRESGLAHGVDLAEGFKRLDMG